MKLQELGETSEKPGRVTSAFFADLDSEGSDLEGSDLEETLGETPTGAIRGTDVLPGGEDDELDTIYESDWSLQAPSDSVHKELPAASAADSSTEKLTCKKSETRIIYAPLGHGGTEPLWFKFYSHGRKIGERYVPQSSAHASRT